MENQVDVNFYIEEALKKLKETYPWATKKMFRKNYTYKIEKINDKYQFISYHKWSDNDIDKEIIDINKEEIINLIIRENESSIEDANPVKEIFKIPLECGIDAHGWTLEIYQFRSHKLGGYSSYVQAGNRSTGGSREFFIPPSYMKGNFDKFLEKYEELVPPWAFGLDKEYLKKVSGLKEFLGFKN